MREHTTGHARKLIASHLFELPGIHEAVFGEVSRRGIFLLREHAHHTGNGVTVVVPETFEAEKTETSSPTEKLFLAFLERRLHHRHRESFWAFFGGEFVTDIGSHFLGVLWQSANSH